MDAKDALHRLQGTLSISIERAAARLSSPLHAFAMRTHSGASDLRLHQWRRLALVFAPLLLAIIVSGLLTVRGVRDLIDDERIIAHSHDIISQIAEEETAFADAEIAQRNYLLTGSATDLAAYSTAHAAIDANVIQLQVLTANDTAQRYRTAQLKSLIVERHAELQLANALQAQQRTAEAVAVVGSARSTQTMESLRALLAQMDAAEDQRMDAQLRATSGRLFGGQVQLLAATAANILLLAVLFVLIWDAFGERERHLRTEREARAEAERAILLRDQFLSVASHELRTPVTGLVSGVDLLERRLSRILPLDERLRQSLATLHRQLTRLQALIATMLDVSRIERGQLSIAHDPLDLVSLVQTVVEEVRPTAQAHPIELIAPAGALFVRGDAVRLSQVLLNLLQNAIKYSPDGGPIQVKMTRTASEVVLSVTDHGMGIPADAVPHLFERFYRAPPVRSEHISGMGIGLYVVGEIVALHGGEISVSSTEGVGSTFTVRLPIIAAEESVPAAAAAATDAVPASGHVSSPQDDTNKTTNGGEAPSPPSPPPPLATDEDERSKDRRLLM
jgi:signal transduction histidine kinase